MHLSRQFQTNGSAPVHIMTVTQLQHLNELTWAAKWSGVRPRRSIASTFIPIIVRTNEPNRHSIRPEAQCVCSNTQNSQEDM
jgi:hypothetical protein